MTPDTFNFPAHKRGDTFKGYIFQISTGPKGGPFTPVDFTGAVAKLQLRRSAVANISLEWKSDDDSITFDGNGQVHMQPKTGEEMNIDAISYFWDLQVKLADGTTNTYVEGMFTIVNDISR